jgi:prevent-host-death family protein
MQIIGDLALLGVGAGLRTGEDQTGRRTVARGSTGCYHGSVDAYPEITQRDLRTRSREIMDAVEHGHSFTVTRDGHRIGELIPLRRLRRFVPRQEFAAMSRNAPAIDLDAFRADQDAALDHEGSSPYER